MAQMASKLSSKIIEKARSVARSFIRGLAIIAIVATYGLGHAVSVIGISGLAMTASTTPAQAWRGGRGGWGRGGWGRGGWGRGRGWGGGRGWCYWHPYACR
jgi:hypothetical protein